jgi:hypothetical protein
MLSIFNCSAHIAPALVPGLIVDPEEVTSFITAVDVTLRPTAERDLLCCETAAKAPASLDISFNKLSSGGVLTRFRVERGIVAEESVA